MSQIRFVDSNLQIVSTSFLVAFVVIVLVKIGFNMTNDVIAMTKMSSFTKYLQATHNPAS